MNPRVFKQHLHSTGRYFLTRYYGKNKEEVLQEATTALSLVDSRRSPNLSNPYQTYAGWNVDLEYFGLD